MLWFDPKCRLVCHRKLQYSIMSGQRLYSHAGCRFSIIVSCTSTRGVSKVTTTKKLVQYKQCFLLHKKPQDWLVIAINTINKHCSKYSSCSWLVNWDIYSMRGHFLHANAVLCLDLETFPLASLHHFAAFMTNAPAVQSETTLSHRCCSTRKSFLGDCLMSLSQF